MNRQESILIRHNDSGTCTQATSIVYKDRSVLIQCYQIPSHSRFHYASVRGHQGLSLSRKDDLESLCYVFIELATGSLPWDGQEDEEIEELKTKMACSDICKDLPPEFAAMLRYVRNIIFEEDPNYGVLHVFLNAAGRQNEYQEDIPDAITLCTEVCGLPGPHNNRKTLRSCQAVQFVELDHRGTLRHK